MKSKIEKILPNQSVGIDIDDWKEFIEQELDKAREDTLDEVKYTLAKDTRYEFRFTEISELLSKLKEK